MVEYAWRRSVAATRLREEMILREVVRLRRLVMLCLGLHSLVEGPGVYEVSTLVDFRSHPLCHIIGILIV